MTEKEIQELAYNYFHGKTTPEEEALLHQWYESSGHLEEEIVVNTDGEGMKDVQARLFAQLQSEIERDREFNNDRKVLDRRWLYYAASFFLLLSFTGIYYYSIKQPETKTHYTQLLSNDVGPGGNNAILELADGSKINLDQSDTGELADMGGITVNKIADGVLSIEISNSEDQSPNHINTIRTPQGGQYQIQLPDGTDVWLNAFSILKFPSVFAKDVREVELVGEAYFEVAQLKDENSRRIPFFVRSKEQKVEVLGTHFNVNSYPDEKVVKTTLVEGSVRILAVNSTLTSILKPGQQALVQDGHVDIQEADIESDIAWKNGDFIFNHESLQSIMKKIGRWYDVEVIYQNSFEEYKFSGAVSRSRNLSEVLKIMELTGKIKFKIEGRRVIVMT